MRSRIRVVIKRTDNGWISRAVSDETSLPEDLSFDQPFATSRALFDEFASAGLRVRLVVPISIDEEGNAIESLVCLAPIPPARTEADQSLDEHVGAVEMEAKRIAEQLDLKDPFRSALLFAAKWHDEGKKADIWQRYVTAQTKTASSLANQSVRAIPKKSLRGYRHEFGSLLRICYPSRYATSCELPNDAEAHDLALHLIATHHGFGRPHFPKPVDRDFTTQQRNDLHVEVMQRFARLQRKYGWWQLAWLENLLRCADGLASGDSEAEDDPDEAYGAEGGSR